MLTSVMYLEGTEWSFSFLLLSKLDIADLTDLPALYQCVNLYKTLPCEPKLSRLRSCIGEKCNHKVNATGVYNQTQ